MQLIDALADGVEVSIGALIAALMFVTYVPAFSLWLPRLLMGYKG
ncbi:MAG: hypothetical protein QHD01_33210 [Bradyrhizobium sp.]|nr:hypothetical protein [Bradyrhizobium sp.]MDX3971431.1 hypothetical protein [Bradyrhizobium sp.]